MMMNFCFLPSSQWTLQKASQTSGAKKMWCLLWRTMLSWHGMPLLARIRMEQRFEIRSEWAFRKGVAMLDAMCVPSRTNSTRFFKWRWTSTLVCWWVCSVSNTADGFWKIMSMMQRGSSSWNLVKVSNMKLSTTSWRNLVFPNMISVWQLLIRGSNVPSSFVTTTTRCQLLMMEKTEMLLLLLVKVQ